MSTALYRRYRPETFADVIGQEHVTDPLMAAIQKDRVNHAYLFSGPRGCGKTTSARILARCLNCAQGPTPVPCGVCGSCVELARSGSGSLDVIEIDAASHGGVDDARDLRERATYAPVRDRYKIFIIDEAHMVTSAGFNALLKIVEEPPEHIKFIFATTEPDKVIGTIRSRTHHYPFRLVPPEPLLAYLELLCRQETIPVAPGVLSLVIRAGGGSVRDSLSVLDQLMAGAGPAGLDYELAVSLLGYTHATLLDDVVDAFAAGDAATVFGAVDRVIQTGHDPRRFVEDLLERFRDLIIVNAVPDSAASILRGVPEDQISRMRTQANQLGRGELSRAADITNTALTEMTGATSPRLHLELLCARILLPAADDSENGMLARVDRIERRLQYAGGTSDQAAVPGRAPESGAPAPETAPGRTAPRPAAPERKVPEKNAPLERTAPGIVPAAENSNPAGSKSAVPGRPQPAPGAAPDGAPPIEMIRRAWPEIMDELAKIKRTTWLNVNPDAKPRSLNGNQLLLVFATPGNAIAFQRGTHVDNLTQAIHRILGLDCSIEAVHDGARAAGESGPKVPPSRRAPATDKAPAADADDSARAPRDPVQFVEPLRQQPVQDDGWGTGEPPPEEYDSGPESNLWQTSEAAAAAQHSEPDAPADSGARQAPPPVPAIGTPQTADPQQPAVPAKPLSRYQRLIDEAARNRQTGRGPSGGAASGGSPSGGTASNGTVDSTYTEDVPSADDETIEESGLVGRPAIERILNGRLVEERSVDGL